MCKRTCWPDSPCIAATWRRTSYLQSPAEMVVAETRKKAVFWLAHLRGLRWRRGRDLRDVQRQGSGHAPARGVRHYSIQVTARDPGSDSPRQHRQGWRSPCPGLVLARAHRSSELGGCDRRGTQEGPGRSCSRAGHLRALTTSGRSCHTRAHCGGGRSILVERAAQARRVLAGPVGIGGGAEVS